jgi:hypothetical protein
VNEKQDLERIMRADRQGIERSTWPVAVVLAILALVVLSLSSGCDNKNTADARKELEKLKNKKAEKPKPPFAQMRVFSEPNERAFTDAKDQEKQNQTTIRNAIKPGHWTGVLVEAKANNFDFSGELYSEPRDNQQRLVDLEGSPFRLAMSRPAALAKGQKKSLEAIFYASPLGGTIQKSDVADSNFYVEQPGGDRRTNTWIYNQLRSPQSGIESPPDSDLLPHMPSYQYYVYVLARDSARYRFLKVLDSVRPPGESESSVDDANYRVLCPQVRPPLALPAQPLCWTSVAYVVWDDVLPSVLSAEQRQAMLDWLHWGGGLIISGPQTLDTLRGTFLEPYLPATASETVKLDAASLAQLNAEWTVAVGRASDRANVTPVEPWSGVKLAKHPAAEFVPGTGELVAERRVGRGRVVVTAFRLNEPELINWRSFDSFFNGCILRRPRRQYDETRNRFEYVGARALHRFDPALNSQVRFFTRDARDPAHPVDGQTVLWDTAIAQFSLMQANTVQPNTLPTAPVQTNTVPPGIVLEGDVVPGSVQAGAVPVVASPPGAPGQAVAVAQPTSVAVSRYISGVTPEQDQFETFKSRGGVAGWNDFSDVSASAGHALRKAAGISVPKREFVFWMVAIYLLLIVPVNWLVFRLAGRVEWAWIAVPVCAIAWGAVVIWSAQLDIGFARAETEVAVLEVQAGFPRAHLTRYTALYSSLSTSYNVLFDDPSAVALPFAVDLNLLKDQSRSTVMWRNFGRQQLSDFTVSSNSTGMVHSEQMFDLGGSLIWTEATDVEASLENNTRVKLSGAAIVRRRLDEKGKPIDESAWLGDLVSGAKVAVTFQAHDAAALGDARNQSALTAKQGPEGGLCLRKLVDFAQNHETLEPGDVRLVAWRDQALKGVRIEPTAAQARRATLVVANLAFGKGQPPRPDVNLRAQDESAADAERRLQILEEETGSRAGRRGKAPAATPANVPATPDGDVPPPPAVDAPPAADAPPESPQP